MNIEDCEELRRYLLHRGISSASEAAFHPLADGVSSRTVRVDLPGGESWVLKQALPVLRVPVHWESSPDRSSREAEGARVLARLLPPKSIPAVIFEDTAHHLFAMSLAPGVPWKELLLRGSVDSRHFEAAGRMLACIHSASATAAPDFRSAFADTSVFESLRLEPYYEYTAAQVHAAAPLLHSLGERARMHRLCLVHGDFSPKNLMVHGETLVLLDHGVIHFGDPAFDTGFVLAHFLSKMHHMPSSREALGSGAQTFWRSYMEGVTRMPWHASAEQERSRTPSAACSPAWPAGPNWSI